MKKTYKSLLLLSYMLLLPLGQFAHAGCGAHDHNCFHGVYPNDPTLGNIPRGDATLDITTTYDNTSGTADVNQHVALPEDRGPFVASGSEGIAVEQTPVGDGPNVIYHDQQVVQYAEGSSGGQLTTTDGQEQTTMIGNVASGDYEVGLHNYDIEESGEDANFNTTITAGGRGYFGGRSGSHIATAFEQEITLNGDLAPDGTTTAAFEYTNAGFDPHAQGIYLIPSSTWNIGGIPTDSPIIRHFEYLDPMGQDGAAIDFLNHLTPLSHEEEIEFGGWMYDAGSGRSGFSLSTGGDHVVDISEPEVALAVAGVEASDVTAMWHTHTRTNDVNFSMQDLFAADYFNVDSYVGAVVQGNGFSGVSVNSAREVNIDFDSNQRPTTLNAQLGVTATIVQGNYSYTTSPLTENINSQVITAYYGRPVSAYFGENNGEATFAISRGEVTREYSVEGANLNSFFDISGGFFLSTDEALSIDSNLTNTTETDLFVGQITTSEIRGFDSNDIRVGISLFGQDFIGPYEVDVPDMVTIEGSSNPLPGLQESSSNITFEHTFNSSSSRDDDAPGGGSDCGCSNADATGDYGRNYL